MNTQTYTPKQQALLNGLSGDALSAMQKAIAEKLFWAVGIDTLCGGYSLGNAGDGIGESTPCLYATKEEAAAELKEDQERYAEESAEGDRDDDDEFEGELVAVRWDGGDTLEIWSENNDYLIEGDLTVARAMGE